MAEPRAPVSASTSLARDSESAGETVPGTTIRIFLSSTFADFQTERDVLQRRVFPELRQLCAASGFHLQPIDLRWGVSEAAGTDHQTLHICFDQLDQCRRVSPDCFMLILLGQRYGSCLLPPEVSQALVERLLPALDAAERAQFAAAYRLDANAVPPEYVLLHPDGPAPTEDELLRQVLVRAGRAVGISADDLLLFTGSATHREIQRGLLGAPSDDARAAGVLCALRTFSGGPRGPIAEQYVEADPARAEALQRVTEAVAERLSPRQMLRYAIDWRDDAGPMYDEEALAAALLDLLRPKLEAVIAARTMAAESAAEQGYDSAALANTAFAAERAAHVEGRDAELARLAAYLAGEAGDGQPLVIAGVAGSGKSTLLAETASRAAAAHPGAALIVRYCGVTPGTERLSALLADLRQAIAHAYGLPQPSPLSDENELVSAVAAQLSTLAVPPERPLLLVLDALDQLSERTQRTDWLPTRLAPHVRVVVSLLADRAELGYLAGRLPTEQILSLAPLGRAAGRAMLRDLLAAAPARTLTPAQEDAVLAAFATQGLPLYLRLLAAGARTWRSFDPPLFDGAPLPANLPDLLDRLLAGLEAPERSGRALVERALGDLAVARFGLAEDELLELLAHDETVRDEQRALSPYSPPINPQLPLPVTLWARLHAHVAPLLTERQADGGARLLCFYHGQLRAAVAARYLAGPDLAARHRALAEYFADQPWLAGPDRWNWRKVRELVSQWEGAGERPSAEQALGGLADTMAQARIASPTGVAGTIAVMGSLKEHLDTAGYWSVGLRLYAEELAYVRAAGYRNAEGETLGNMGLLAEHLGQPEAAVRDYTQALALLREVGNRASEGSTLNNLGTLAFGLGRLAEAGSYLEQSLTIRREVGDRAGEGSTLSNLGQLADQLGRRDDAAHYYAQALAVEREVGDRAGEAVTLNNLGQLAYHLGRGDEAASYFRQALDALREVGDHPGEAQALNNLGSLAGRLGDWQEAADYFGQALVIQREVGERAAEGTTLTNLGVLASHLGKPREAAEYFEHALTTVRAVGDRQGEGNALNSLGALARDQGRFDDAAGYYAQALQVVRAVGDRATEGALHNNLGSLTRAQGRPDEARRHFEQALEIERAIGDRTGEGHTLNNLGALVREESQWQQAGRYFEQALAIWREVGDREGEAGTLTNLGALARVQGRPQEAQRDYEQALAICEAIGAVGLAQTVRGNMEYLAEQQQRQEQQEQQQQQQTRKPTRWWPFGRRK